MNIIYVTRRSPSEPPDWLKGRRGRYQLTNHCYNKDFLMNMNKVACLGLDTPGSL